MRKDLVSNYTISFTWRPVLKQVQCNEKVISYGNGLHSKYKLHNYSQRRKEFIGILYAT